MESLIFGLVLGAKGRIVFMFGELGEKLKTQNSKLKTQNSKLKSQNSKLKSQNSKLLMLNKNSGAKKFMIVS